MKYVITPEALALRTRYVVFICIIFITATLVVLGFDPRIVGGFLIAAALVAAKVAAVLTEQYPPGATP